MGGGGLLLVNGHDTVENCVFLNNSARSDGLTDSRGDCLGALGGGLLNHGGVSTVKGCLFLGNVGMSGGGICNEEKGDLLMVDCLLSGNEAIRIGTDGGQGGGFFSNTSSSARMRNCTISGNRALHGGGLYLRGESRLISANTIVWGNEATSIGSQILNSGSTLDITYSCISNGWEGEGNTALAPLFVDADGPDDIVGTEDDDLRLLPGSSCIDTGRNDIVDDGEVDLDGEPRIQNGRVDMGSYESVTDCNGNGTADYIELADGLLADCTGNGIPDMCEPDCNGTGQADSCDILAGISEDCALDGIPDECEDDCNGNGVADSCDILNETSEDCTQNGIPDECEEDCDNNGVADSCDIAVGTSSDCNTNQIPDVCEDLASGRLYVNETAPSGGDGGSWSEAFNDLNMALCLAESGFAEEIWVAGGTYRPAGFMGDRDATFAISGDLALLGGFAGWETDLTQRDITQNQTILSGDLGLNDEVGCLHMDDNSFHVVTTSECEETALLDGFVIMGGNANGTNDDSRGAAIYNDGGSLQISNCMIMGNRSGWVGAGIANRNGAFVIFVNCVFSGNESEFAGGAISNESSGVLMDNCAVVYNGAGNWGGGVYNDWGGIAVANSTIFWANWDAGGTDQSAQIHGGSVQVSYCCVEKLTGSFGGEGNIAAFPAFVDMYGPDKTPGTLDDDLRHHGSSPCVNSGDPVITHTVGVMDYDGNPRVLCGQVDMGPFEFGAGDADCDGIIDLDDYAAWMWCVTGPGGGEYEPGCHAFDLDVDGDVDLADFASYQRVFGG